MIVSVEDPSSTCAPIWRSPWPASELCTVEACPVCKTTRRTILYDKLIDNVFFCAPGSWTSWRCLGCGSAYLDPRPSPASIHLAYETYHTHQPASVSKPDYAELVPVRKLRRRLVNGYTNWRYATRESPASSLGIAVLWCSAPHRARIDQEYRHLPRLPADGGAVLDVGCGNGSFLRTARSCGWNAIGVDPDPKAVSNCRRQGYNAILGGIEQFDGEHGLFDFITMSHVIEHVHDPLAILKACHRLLKPGGRLWVETPNIDSSGHRRYGQNWRGLEPPRHLVMFNRQSLSRGLSSAGFARIESRPTSYSLTGMARASEAIKQNLPADKDVRLSWSTQWTLLKNKIKQAIVPDGTDFLTLVAFKE